MGGGEVGEAISEVKLLPGLLNMKIRLPNPTTVPGHLCMTDKSYT